MIIGTGIDIVDIRRFSKIMEKNGDYFLKKIFTDNEIMVGKRYIEKRFVSYFSNRFAIKEAMSKAVGCGIGKYLKWHDIDIINNNLGRPIIVMNINIIEAINASNDLSLSIHDINIHTSVSDEKNYSIATVIIDKL